MCQEIIGLVGASKCMQVLIGASRCWAIGPLIENHETLEVGYELLYFFLE